MLIYVSLMRIPSHVHVHHTRSFPFFFGLVVVSSNGECIIETPAVYFCIPHIERYFIPHTHLYTDTERQFPSPTQATIPHIPHPQSSPVLSTLSLTPHLTPSNDDPPSRPNAPPLLPMQTRYPT
ncbi:hypothetical protein P692DRAFT_2076863 [Suillus brevipes Sb2]|nr:hypothetical protein P692DRAFT_2076863 [Suillus brevipes Sb2]